MKNIKLILAYEGTHYLGWQKTAMGPSIEEALEIVLAKILRHPVALQAASRTDAGVHAEGQVVNFFTAAEITLEKLQKSLNSLLPSDISVLKMEKTSVSFHPTLESQGKEYHYFVCLGSTQLPFHRNFSWHFSYPLRVEEMKKAAALLKGRHDFSAFTNEKQKNINPRDQQVTIRLARQRRDVPFEMGQCCEATAHFKKDVSAKPQQADSHHLLTSRVNNVREVYDIGIEPFEDRLKIRVAGNNFLYKMVRNLVGTLLYVGCGRLSAEEIPAILESKDRRRAGVTAPAHGLLLKEVYYDRKK